MAATAVYSEVSHTASEENLLAQETASTKAETVSLNESDIHDEEAIGVIRRTKKSTKYLKLLWSITLYALAIWGVYSLILKAMPMLPLHNHGTKHITLSEDQASHHDRVMMKVPLGKAPIEQLEVKPGHHHGHKVEEQSEEQAGHPDGNSEHQHEDKKTKWQPESQTEKKPPHHEAEHHHHETQEKENKDEHAAHKAAQWKDAEKAHDHHKAKETKEQGNAGDKAVQPEHHHHTPTRSTRRKRRNVSSFLTRRGAEDEVI